MTLKFSVAIVRFSTVLLLASSATPTAPEAPGADCGGTRAEIVVKVEAGHRLDEILAAYPVERVGPLLESHNLFQLRATDPGYCGDYKWSDQLADTVKHHPAVDYAESQLRSDLSDGRFHAWPDGDPDDAGTDPVAWTSQPAVTQLRLPDAHLISRGAGAVVAVLDTGVEATHPALAGRLLPGYDYVDDDASPEEMTNAIDDDDDGATDESYGHGTFVSGTVALVAPEAQIIPMRVLDSDGRGNAPVVAEAIADAVASGADVINMAFGSPLKPLNNRLRDAIKRARERGVLVVASAGNEGGREESYPAAMVECLAVGAETADRQDWASFSNRGSWVDVTAPGTAIVGPFPGGRYARWNGTSVAAPLVSGQTALIVAARRTLSVGKIDDAITKSATMLKPANSEKLYPINVPRSLTTAD
jgi:subtilisin family serine protease